MQISLRFFKRLLLSVIFITSNGVYAEDLSEGSTISYSQDQGVVVAQPVSTTSTTVVPPRGGEAFETRGAVIEQSKDMSSTAAKNIGNSGVIVKTDKSGVNCASSPNPAAKDDDANKADCSSADTISQAVGQLVSLGTKSSAQISSAHATFREKWKSCIKVQGVAANACLENLSPAISGASGPIGLLAAAGSGMSSANGSCDTVSKIMDIANKALTAYNSACTAAKASCAFSCNAAVSSLETIQKLAADDTCIQTSTSACGQGLAPAKTTLGQALGKELDKGNTLSMAGKKQVCKGKYVELGISALGGIAAVVMAMGQADQCDQATAADTTDCTIPANAQTPKCLCEANPRLQGCANGLQKVGDASGAGGIGSTKADKAASDNSMPPLGGPGGLEIERDPAAASGSGIPGSGGGGSGLGGSGLSGNSGNDAGGGKGRAGFDTNILGGSGGGGGGGGAWGKGFSAGSANSKYGAYLPGGAKDPAMNGNAWANEVTGQGGKSNWEKVRERYKDNKTSLLNK